MKYLLYISFLFLPIIVLSQEDAKSDSISTLSPFIGDYSNQLNIKLDATNDHEKYFIPFGNNKAEIRTNLNINYGVVLSYRFLSVRIGVRPKLSESETENKGETDIFRLRVKLLFDNWTHRFEYNYRKGFYIGNTEDFETDLQNLDFKYQLQDLTTNIFSGSSHYRFNKNYSFKAIESNTEIQLKSAGTLLAGIDYTLYFVSGAEQLKIENQIIERDSYNEFDGFTPILNVGYHYTFVFKKYWYTNVYGNPGFGVDFSNIKSFENNDYAYSSNISMFLTLRTGASAGYNGEKIYFGGEFKYNVNSEKFVDKDIILQPINNSFHIFFGYRFKAPKQVTDPVKYIEKKVPVLKKEVD